MIGVWFILLVLLFGLPLFACIEISSSGSETSRDA